MDHDDGASDDASAVTGRKYRLGFQLRGHEDDVRGIAICGNLGIATSSRDRTVRFWAPEPEKKRYALQRTLVGHTRFVGPVAWVPPSERFPQGAVVSGGMDALVLLWDLRTGDRSETMQGHDNQVTGVTLDANGDIISCSVDCTLKRWRKGCAIETWEAHKGPVQAVLALKDGEIITGSTDSTLKLWRGRTCLHTFVGHSDTVRGLAYIPGVGILSASHDCTIKLWALTGQVLMDMVGHTSLIYSVAAHTSGIVASGSEDRFLKIWRDGNCIQSIEHPGCVWDVKFFENGDIVTACSDGVARIWTTRDDCVCDSHELEAYKEQLSMYNLSRRTVGGLKLMDLPGVEALQVPGKSDGQTLVVREGDTGIAYLWNLREYRWDKVGEVVDGPGAEKPKVLNGVKYDYVFDVDIGDGEPIRKLPYNKSDNPYDVADKWLVKENLPLSYREQVVAFILQNTGQNSFTPNPSFRDPYTGASAYVPGESSFHSATPPTKSFKHIPKKGMLLFDTAQFDGIIKKIVEFNSALFSDQEQKMLSLSELELARLTAMISVLKNTSYYHSTTFAEADMVLLLKLLQSWPVQMMFPVVDVLRMMVLHPDGSHLLVKHCGDSFLTETLRKAMMAPIQPGNVLTVMRAVTNLFRQPLFHQWLQDNCGQVLDDLSECRPSFNKTSHLAYATLILNYAVLLIDRKDDDKQALVLSAAVEIAEDENQETDSKYRALVAIGSLMLDGSVKSIAVDFDVGTLARTARSSKETKIAEVGSDIELLLK